MFLKKIFLKGLVLALLSFVAASGVNFVLAQNWTEPAGAPPAGNVPGVIWNSSASGTAQTASFYVSGWGRIGQGGAFGNFSPDAVWMISSPNAYFGNGVAGTIIGAGAGQAAGDISTDGILKANRIRSRGGTYASPGISFSAEPDDGMMITDESGGYHALGLVVGGAPIMVMDTGYVNIYGYGVFGSGFGLPLTLRGYDTTNLATTVAVKIQNAGGELSAVGAKALSVSNGVTEEAYFGAGAANPRFVVLGRAGQTGNLLEARNSAGTVLTSISPAGKVTATKANVGPGTFFNNGEGYANALNLSGSMDMQGNTLYLNTAGTNLYHLNSSELSIGWAGSGNITTANGVLTIAPSGGASLLLQPNAGNVGIGTAAPSSKLDVVGNINSSADIIGARLCIGADCRNAWPAVGGGGDISAVNVGTGVTGGGASGDVTVSLDTAYTDGRYVNVPGDTMTGSLVISGVGNDLTVADSGAFGGYAPDATWKVSTPNIYIGNGVLGTIIGAGGTQAAGAITTDGNVTIGNDLRIVTNDSSANPGMPWIRSSGGYLVMNSNTGALYLNQDVAQPIYFAQQQDVIAANGNMGLGTTNPTRRLTLGGVTPQIDFGVGAGYADTGSPGLFWYNDNISYGIYKTAGGWNAPNYQQLQLNWPTGIVIDGGSAYGRSGTVLQPNGGNVGIGVAVPASRLDVAGNINSSGDVIGIRLCIGADCRNAWPAVGGGGDISAVNVGTGVTGGGVTGDVTVSLDTAYTDGRYVNVPGDTMTGSLVISGAGNDITVADSGAFGGHSPNATWKVSSPNAYFGDGITGTIIGAGGTQAAGAITTDGNVTIGNDLRIVTNDSSANPGMPWIRSSGGYLVMNSNTGALYLNQDVAQPIYMAQQGIKVTNGGVYMNSNEEQRLQWGNAGESFLATFVKFAGGSDIYVYSGDGVTPAARFSSTGFLAGGDNQKDLGSVANSWRNIYADGDVIGTRLCIGADCRNAWPAGGGGDITGVSAGTGLTGGGLSGDVTLSLDTAYTDARYLNVGEGGDITGVIAGNGLVTGGLSGDVTLDVGAGTGITVAANAVSLDTTFTDGRYVPFTGGTMTGNLTWNNGRGILITGAGLVSTPTLCLNGDCRNAWPGAVSDIWVNTTGDTMTGDLVMSGATTDINVGGSIAMAGAAFPAAGEIATNGDNIYLNSNRTAAGAGSYSTAISFYGASDGFLAFKSDGASGVAAGALSYFYLSRNLAVNGDITNIANITASGAIGAGSITVSGDLVANYGTFNSPIGTNGATVSSLYGVNTQGQYGIRAVGTGANASNYGIYATASGATTNWAGYFGSGNVYIAHDLYVGSIVESIAPPLSFVMDGNDAYFADDVGINGSLIVDTGICSTDATGECPVMSAGGIYWDIAVTNPFDLAEYILSKQNLEPGDVVVIDPSVDEQIMRSYKPYDTALAGVVSTKPGYLGGQNIEVLAGTQKVMLTLAGRIPTKVTDEGGPIKRGDLLTTSSVPGYAMRCADPASCVGAVVGKAMGELKEGKGTIVVLMSLQ